MYAIIDIETTGTSYYKDKITEIAIFVHDGEKVIDEYTTLINPERSIPYNITQLTGINNEMVFDAPKFYEVAKNIVEITENKTFVAHNVTFDYNFVKQEFKNLGFEFKRQKLCTVQLSRRLMPGKRSYSLGKLCNELGISINGRHRAAGDALATVKLFEMLFDINRKGGNRNLSTINFEGTNRFLKKEIVKDLPEKPGVYYFYNESGDLIYIGKSINIQSRVVSHFNNTSTQKAIDMKEQIADIDCETTGNELIALLKESEEIKQNKPLFNRRQRRSLFNYGIFSFYDENGYLNLKYDKTSKNKDLPVVAFGKLEETKEALYKLIEDYNLCQKLCGLYKSDSSCFHHQIGICSGACVGEESYESYNSKVFTAIKQFEYSQENFFIIEKGRTDDEISVVKVEKGKYIGYGYADKVAIDEDLSLLHDCINKYQDNREIQQIIKLILRKNKSIRILPF
jgi:DNA polymerase III subunit epsilon